MTAEIINMRRWALKISQEKLRAQRARTEEA